VCPLPFCCISPEFEAIFDAHLLRSNAEGVEYETDLADQESDTTALKDRKIYYLSC